MKVWIPTLILTLLLLTGCASTNNETLQMAIADAQRMADEAMTAASEANAASSAAQSTADEALGKADDALVTAQEAMDAADTANMTAVQALKANQQMDEKTDRMFEKAVSK